MNYIRKEKAMILLKIYFRTNSKVLVTTTTKIKLKNKKVPIKQDIFPFISLYIIYIVSGKAITLNKVDQITGVSICFLCLNY